MVNYEIEVYYVNAHCTHEPEKTYAKIEMVVDPAWSIDMVRTVALKELSKRTYIHTIDTVKVSAHEIAEGKGLLCPASYARFDLSPVFDDFGECSLKEIKIVPQK